jgi:hypothetical protein
MPLAEVVLNHLSDRLTEGKVGRVVDAEHVFLKGLVLLQRGHDEADALKFGDTDRTAVRPKTVVCRI